jgi:nucleoside phosphorylase
MPPGFAIEDDIAFGLAETQRAFLERRVIQFPMREANLADYAEKKRIEYYPMKDRYSGLFSDARLGFLGRHAVGLIRRKAHISEQIVVGWQAGADTRARVWKPIKRLLTSSDLRIVRNIPAVLSDKGIALTWSAIGPSLPDAANLASVELRNALQYTYFRQYCEEFSLIALSSIPHMIEEFQLPRLPQSYNYARFMAFLQSFGIADLMLDGVADFILSIKFKPSLISFIDAYCQLAEQSSTIADLTFAAGMAARETRFNWAEFGRRVNPYVDPPTDFEVLELDHALAEAADVIRRQNGLRARAVVKEEARRVSRPYEVKMSPELVLFVALQEELDVLAKSLSLKKYPSTPAASGMVGTVSVDVLCPEDMGRVPAAVEVTRYLEGRSRERPRLILILGLAGGFPEEKTAVGHIICPTTVVDLASRKVIESEDGGAETKFRRKDFDMAPALREVLNSDLFDRDAWSKEAIVFAEWPEDRRPSLHFGMIASVDEVVASGPWRKSLLRHTDKLLGVEMEAGGVCAAASKYGVPVSMLRAVSDNADPAKADDAWRKRGMKTIAGLLQRIPYSDLFNSLGK